ncbi:hypothetical protein AZE42_03588 [Rhizopogon vesiculosus]|uniref:Uncharacterized protein n=1 Tax=Rhizopogon vesiculosus TaxID=180088 RepID=A0A1J8PFZ2_9AGAM|nr:hypothetical protein AZE42_03588 [Rhizopogon vesiculosus]
MSPRMTLAHLSGCRRLLHTSRSSFNFIGLPDPTSNLRPIIYTSSSDLSEPILPHPYSLREFSDDTVDHELQWNLHREQLDAFNHAYWAESNTRFEAAKSSVLAALLPNAPTEAHEHALSEFYKKWVIQERVRQDEYDVELRKRTFEDLSLAAKVEFQRAKKRLGNWRFL